MKGIITFSAKVMILLSLTEGGPLNTKFNIALVKFCSYYEDPRRAHNLDRVTATGKSDIHPGLRSRGGRMMKRCARHISY